MSTEIRRPPIPNPRNPASVQQWMKQTTDNIDRLKVQEPMSVLSLNRYPRMTVPNGSATVDFNLIEEKTGQECFRWTPEAPTKVTCLVAGTYMVIAEFGWDNFVGQKAIYCYFNPRPYLSGQDVNENIGVQMQRSTWVGSVAVGEVLSLYAFQASGVSRLSANENRLQIIRLA